MKKYHFLKCVVGLNFVFLLASCASMNGKKENVSIVNPPLVNPSPTVTPNQTGKNTPAKSIEFKEYLEVISDIEEQFLSQNCVEVLNKVKKLENLIKILI